MRISGISRTAFAILVEVRATGGRVVLVSVTRPHRVMRAVCS